MEGRSTGLRVTAGGAIAFVLVLAVGLVWSAPAPRAAAADDPKLIAQSLARMLQSARAVISKHQAEINDAAVGHKGLTADAVIAEASANYVKATGIELSAIDPDSREGRLIAAQLDAIREVMDEAQDQINAPGIGFKGFIPAVFARLVNEAFADRVGDDAHVKVTAPPDLVRNRKARPDAWEKTVIVERFETPGWVRGEAYSETVVEDGVPRFRMAVPEYYAASCLACHGDPKGSMDVTGYPREGRAENDLGGVVSVTLTAN